MSLVADCMTDAQAPSNSKPRENIVTRILFFFTSIGEAGYKGGNYKPFNIGMLNRSFE
jgi:hypothetical protein